MENPAYNRVDINGNYAIVKVGYDFALGEIKCGKEEGAQPYLSTLAVYQNPIGLINDFIHRGIRTAIWLTKVTDAKSLLAESNRLAELCQKAFDQLNNTEE
ncbi:DUF5405 family protein [Brenneria corticis]|uniref:DUF5405 domain-containing protein n=1 Tax=Brenneria corticis TaxID=2173106 RepID=A0A2U1TJK0_9GAMM|nr:DUF5405 family protein [Brenneria sp. CFCC 11842]PWC09591.1 hypothetical protein DDT56_23600 [Brenneria sp. CFCC 11842]